MSSKVVPVTSAAHFKSITSSSTYTVVDFYAVWCGPCKVISPIFEQLAAAETKPGRISFCKVDVDAQSAVAASYSVSAMPTFLILKGGSVKETIRGADASALRSAVLAAAADAARGPAKSSPVFTSRGHTLGSADTPSRNAPPASGIPNLRSVSSSPAQFAQGHGILQSIVRFLGLYITTLLSFEPERSAEESSFSVKSQPQAGGRKVGTVR